MSVYAAGLMPRCADRGPRRSTGEAVRVPSTERSITVLVVDDQVLIRAGLVALLNAAPGIEVVGEAADGETAVALAARTRPHVVLMDIRMPGAGGIAATRQILAAADQSY